MDFINREEKIWNDIQEWKNGLDDYTPTDFEYTYDRWLNGAFNKISEETREIFFNKLDTWLFHLHALIQGSQLQTDGIQRLLSTARIFDPTIENVSEMKKLTIDQLTYIAEQQIAKHRLYSFLQGGLTGTGSVLLLGIDLPAMTIINLRKIQLIAMTYGNEINTPLEMMISLKVFHIATSPTRWQKRLTDQLLEEIKEHDQAYFYEGNESLTDASWLEQPLKQVMKSLLILIFKKRTIQGVPLISMLLGASLNYQMSRQVSEFAHRFYQYRFLSEVKEEMEF